MAFRFISTAFSAYFLRKKDKQALLSLLLEVLVGGSREVDSEEVNSKVVYGKDTDNKKAGSKKVRRFLADFTLFIFLSSTKSCKKYFSTHFLQLY